MSVCSNAVIIIWANQNSHGVFVLQSTTRASSDRSMCLAADAPSESRQYRWAGLETSLMSGFAHEETQREPLFGSPHEVPRSGLPLAERVLPRRRWQPILCRGQIARVTDPGSKFQTDPLPISAAA
jgi:hypothetical protein